MWHGPHESGPFSEATGAVSHVLGTVSLASWDEAAVPYSALCFVRCPENQMVGWHGWQRNQIGLVHTWKLQHTKKNLAITKRIQASVVLAQEVMWWIISLNRTLSIFYQCFSCFVRSVLMKSITPRRVAKQGLGQRFHCRLHSIAAGASAVAVDSTSMMKHPESHSPQIFLKGLRIEDATRMQNNTWLGKMA